MNKINTFLLLLFTLLVVTTNAQRRFKYRYEIVGGLGATNFLGELGGANQEGTNFVRDLEFSRTRPLIMAGLRYSTSKYTAVRANLSYGILSGNDNLTEERFRKNRNLHFRSPIIEFSAILEGYMVKEDVGHIYKIRNARSKKGKGFRYFGFVGIGAFYFNPKALYPVTNTWVALQPLGTEGQGVPGKPKYSRVSMAIPVGVGLKYALDRKWSIGFEAGLRKTLTDYIDDVSTVYADPNKITENNGGPGAKADMAVYFANPSLGMFDDKDINGNVIWTNTAPGLQRGDPTDKDAYMFASITLNYKILYKRRTRSKF